MKLKNIILGAALALAAAAGFAARAYVNAAPHGPAYTFKGRLTTSGRTFDMTTFAGPDGSMRTIQQADGLRRETVFVPGRGLFARKGDEWVRNTRASVNPAPPPYGDELAAKLRESEQFVRREEVLGQTAYVLRLDEAGGAYTECYIVPAFGSRPVRVVTVDAAGRETSRLEPVSITIGGPSRADLRGDFK